MRTASAPHWLEENQKYLMAALSEVRLLLDRHVGQSKNVSASANPEAHVEQKMEDIAAEMPAPPALDTLCAAFNLSHFERNVLLLSAGIELDSSFAFVCADAQGDPRRAYPTFSLALAALPDAYWSALTPVSPLRRWRLVELGNGETLTASPLRIDERVLHYLCGVSHPDERLAGLLEPVHMEDLAASHGTLAERIAQVWSKEIGLRALPVIQLCGQDREGKRAVAATACDQIGLTLYSLSSSALPVNAAELDTFIRLWEREAVLGASALLLEVDQSDPADTARTQATAHMIEHANGALMVSSIGRRYAAERPIITFDVHLCGPEEQYGIWERALGRHADGLNGRIEVLASQFNLNARSIESVAADVVARFTADNGSETAPGTSQSDALGNALWEACVIQARPRLDDLAQRIKPVAAWEDLVLPAPQKQVLREIATHVRRRAKVYEEWNFKGKGSRGLGISALFAGESGTGKTMASEVLANELRLDLYRIDLSQVVNKYIGETEKNLRRVFDAAEGSGAILLFDEAEALFGKRSDVKDSHDRYANIEVGYLLQRMEAYTGLAILTTNMKNALDTAFLRRIRFVIQFPFPDAAYRSEIWKKVFPQQTPTEGLDVNKLARLNVAGGNIRNIALNAAFFAADAGEPVRMKHLLNAARGEYSKLEKPTSAAEMGGWM